MLRIAVGGLQKPLMQNAIMKACPEAVVTVTNDMNAVALLKRGEVDYYFGACESGGGAAISGCCRIRLRVSDTSPTEPHRPSAGRWVSR